MKLSYVAPALVPQVLGAFARQVKKAFSVGQADAVTPQDMLAAIQDGREMLWAVHDGENVKGAVLVSVPTYSTGRKVWVSMIVGEDMPEWADDVESALTKYRDEVGAMCVEASCRPGLARYLTRRGWRTKAVIMEAPQ